jgi:hypothetical protein
MKSCTPTCMRKIHTQQMHSYPNSEFSFFMQSCTTTVYIYIFTHTHTRKTLVTNVYLPQQRVLVLYAMGFIHHNVTPHVPRHEAMQVRHNHFVRSDAHVECFSARRTDERDDADSCVYLLTLVWWFVCKASMHTTPQAHACMVTHTRTFSCA